MAELITPGIRIEHPDWFVLGTFEQRRQPGVVVAMANEGRQADILLDGWPRTVRAATHRLEPQRFDSHVALWKEQPRDLFS